MSSTMSLSTISLLLKRGQSGRAMGIVDGYPLIASPANIDNSGRASRMYGTVLHVSKSKTVGMTKTAGAKVLKKEVPYHRLVFCRYDLFSLCF
jgi:hypothetical protein